MQLNINDIAKISAEDAFCLKSATGKLLSKLNVMLDNPSPGSNKAIKEQKQLFGASSLAEMLFKLTQLSIALESRGDIPEAMVEASAVSPEGGAALPVFTEADLAMIEDFERHELPQG